MRTVVVFPGAVYKYNYTIIEEPCYHFVLCFNNPPVPFFRDLQFMIKGDQLLIGSLHLLVHGHKLLIGSLHLLVHGHKLLIFEKQLTLRALAFSNVNPDTHEIIKTVTSTPDHLPVPFNKIYLSAPAP